MKQHVFRKPEELNLLLRNPSIRFELAIDQLGLNNSLWQERLRKEYEECGCAAGAIGLLIGLVLGIFVAWLAMLAWWQVVVAGVITGVVSLVSAKLARLAISRSRLKSAICQIQALTTKSRRVPPARLSRSSF